MSGTLEKITKVVGKAVPVSGDDVDTDRIIPARFMKCVTFDGLGEYAFYDVRKNADGSHTNHTLNDPLYSEASIMLVGSNFGCGSSREHAPQALYKSGVRAIIGQSFAEIFFGNSTTLGMPCVIASAEAIALLTQLVESDSSSEVEIDLEALVVRCQDKEFEVSIASSAREGLVKGEWDPIALMMKEPEAIDSVAERLGYDG